MCSTHASAPAAVRGAADRCHAPADLISPDEVEVYRRAGGTRPPMASGLDLLTIRADRVAEVTAFLSGDLTRFGLPARVHA